MSDSNSVEFCLDNFDSFCDALSKTKPRIFFCEQFDEKSSIWNFEEHKHDCIELLYFLYGNAEVTAREQIMQASFYDIVIYPPVCIPHGASSDQPSSRNILHMGGHPRS